MEKNELDQLISELLTPTTMDSQPNLSQISLLLRDLNSIKLNIKQNGYLIAQRLAEELRPTPTKEPAFVGLKSKPSTQIDLESEWAAHWLARIGSPVMFHRKLWELAYVPQALWERGVLTPGSRALGFGCGVEPLPSLFASLGIDVVMTDLAPEDQVGSGWTGTNQHTHSVAAAFRSHIVSQELYDRHVSLRYVDMRAIPDDLRGFDFCWSICALEHLGSIQAGLEFITRSLDTLRPGGVAVHTTEYNYMSDGPTIDNWPTVLFQRRHFTELVAALQAAGHEVAPLDFDVGKKPMDLFIDIPPYVHDMTANQTSAMLKSAHLKLTVDGFASTCFGFIVRKRSSEQT